MEQKKKEKDIIFILTKMRIFYAGFDIFTIKGMTSKQWFFRIAKQIISYNVDSTVLQWVCIIMSFTFTSKY